MDEEQNKEGRLGDGLGIHVTVCVVNPVFLAQDLELEPFLRQWVCPSLHLFFPECPLDGALVFQLGALGTILRLALSSPAPYAVQASPKVAPRSGHCHGARSFFRFVPGRLSSPLGH